MSLCLSPSFNFQFFKKIRFDGELPESFTFLQLHKENEISRKEFEKISLLEVSYEVSFEGNDTREYLHTNDGSISISWETPNNKDFLINHFLKKIGVIYFSDIPGNRTETKELMDQMYIFFNLYKGLFYSNYDFILSRKGVNFFSYEVGFVSENEFFLFLNNYKYTMLYHVKQMDDMQEINAAQSYFFKFIKVKIKENRLKFITNTI